VPQVARGGLVLCLSAMGDSSYLSRQRCSDGNQSGQYHESFNAEHEKSFWYRNYFRTHL